MSMMERITKTTLIKETKYSKIFIGELDDSSQVIVKLLKNANIDIYKTLASIKSLHFPEILELFENTENGESELTIIEEYIEGETLSDLLHKKSFSHDEIFNLMQQLCDGISFLHQMNPPFIHRDLKPQNLILTKDGILKIIDFNAARIYKSDSSADTVHLGTAEYAPPEQFGYSQTDVRSDIYCLGIILYEIAYGKEFKPKNTRQFLMPNGLDSIVARCTMYDPEQRYQTVQELQADLIYYQKANMLYKRKPREITYLFAAGAILGLTLLVALFMWLPGSRPVSLIENTTAPAETTTPAATETNLAADTKESTINSTKPTSTAPATTQPTTTEPQTTTLSEPVTEAPSTVPETTPQPTTVIDTPDVTNVSNSPSLVVTPNSDTITIVFPELPDSRVETFQLYDTTGTLYATIEVRHNPSSPKLLPFNTKLRINGTECPFSTSQLAKTDNGTITLTLQPVEYFGTTADAFAGFTCTGYSTALPKLPAPTDLQWDPANPGYASWTSSYQCVQFNSKNGKVHGYNTNLRSEQGYYYRGMPDLIQKESATYCIIAMALGDWETGDSDLVSTEPLVYTIPSTKLPTITNLWFEGTTIHFEPIEGVKDYHIELFGIDKNTKEWKQARHARMVDKTYSDLGQWINQEINKYDTLAVKVNAVSPDLMNIAAGDPSELCIYIP